MVGTHFFEKKNTILCILKDILPFKMYKIIFFPENMKKIFKIHSKDVECIVMFLNAMPRGMSVAHIYVLKIPLPNL